MNRKSFLRSLLGAIAFSPVVCKLVEKMQFRSNLPDRPPIEATDVLGMMAQDLRQVLDRAYADMWNKSFL